MTDLTPASCDLFNRPCFQFAQLKKYAPESIPQLKADYKIAWENWRAIILRVAALLRHYTDTMRERGKAGVILTCKEHLTDWYARFGFRNHGIADSEHGGATWYDMKYIWAP